MGGSGDIALLEMVSSSMLSFSPGARPPPRGVRRGVTEKGDAPQSARRRQAAPSNELYELSLNILYKFLTFMNALLTDLRRSRVCTSTCYNVCVLMLVRSLAFEFGRHLHQVVNSLDVVFTGVTNEKGEESHIIGSFH